MPKIIKNGRVYGGAPSESVWEGTQEQYDAIVNKDPNIIYYITDGAVEPIPATNIEYDNSLSGLSATQVQSAIDEVNAKRFSYTSLYNSSTSSTGDITIPNFDKYDFVLVKLLGDNNNGISIFCPTIMKSENITYSLYAINSGETFSGYAIHSQGWVKDGKITVSYLKVTGWSAMQVVAYGIKYA